MRLQHEILVFYVISHLYLCTSITRYNNNNNDNNNEQRFSWEIGLREATYQTLLRERYNFNNLRELIYKAPINGYEDDVTPFGDVTILAKGQLYATSNQDLLFQLDSKNHCKRCKGNWENYNRYRLLALWIIKRIRHRDPSLGFKYELEYKISPKKELIEGDHIDYGIPGHIFIVKTDPPLINKRHDYRNVKLSDYKNKDATDYKNIKAFDYRNVKNIGYRSVRYRDDESRLSSDFYDNPKHHRQYVGLTYLPPVSTGYLKPTVTYQVPKFLSEPDFNNQDRSVTRYIPSILTPLPHHTTTYSMENRYNTGYEYYTKKTTPYDFTTTGILIPVTITTANKPTTTTTTTNFETTKPFSMTSLTSKLTTTETPTTTKRITTMKVETQMSILTPLDELFGTTTTAASSKPTMTHEQIPSPTKSTMTTEHHIQTTTEKIETTNKTTISSTTVTRPTTTKVSTTTSRTTTLKQTEKPKMKQTEMIDESTRKMTPTTQKPTTLLKTTTEKLQTTKESTLPTSKTMPSLFNTEIFRPPKFTTEATTIASDGVSNIEAVKTTESYMITTTTPQTTYSPKTTTATTSRRTRPSARTSMRTRRPTTTSEITRPSTKTSQRTRPETTVSERTRLPTTTAQITSPEATVSERTRLPTTTAQRTSPETTVSEITRPSTTTSQRTSPETTVSEITRPSTTTSQRTSPETTVSEITRPPTTIPQRTSPETTVSEITRPPTTIPQRTRPETTASEITGPSTITSPNTSPTTISETTKSLITIPPTTIPQTTVPSTTLLLSTASDTMRMPTTILQRTDLPNTTINLQTTTTTTTTTRKPDPFADIFGDELPKESKKVLAITRRMLRKKNAKELLNQNQNKPKIIFSNFYKADVIDDVDKNSVTRKRELLKNTETDLETSTSQSVFTSISFEVNKRNDRLMKERYIMERPIKAKVQQINDINDKNIQIFKAEMPEYVQNETVNKDDDIKIMKHLTLSIINNAKSIEILSKKPKQIRKRRVYGMRMKRINKTRIEM